MSPARRAGQDSDDATDLAHHDWVIDPRERLWKELEVEPTDLVVEKTAPSAFLRDDCRLHELLTQRGITTLVVTGTVTNVCVESTVRDASALGYRVILVADGCAAVRDQDHNTTLHVVYRTFGDVRPTADVLDLIAQGPRSPRR